MLITDEALQDHIRNNYKGYLSYNFPDVAINEEEEFSVVRDLYEVNENAINLDKDVYVRNLKHNRQTNCFNLQMMCESLNVDGNELGEEIFKELERYNKTFNKAYIRNGKNWTDLAAFFVACEKAKEVLGNKNPRVFFNISKFFFMLSKQTLNSANIKLDYVNLRSQFELMFIDARNSNFDVIIQPVCTKISKIENREEYETTMMSKYIHNFPLHKELRFDHEHHVFGVVSGLAARTNMKGIFGRIKAYSYQFRLLDLLRNEYAYLNLNPVIGNGIEEPVFINGKQIAHKVLLKKQKVRCNFSAFSMRTAKLMLGKDKQMPEYKYVYDCINPIELSTLTQEEIYELIESREGIVVYLIDETLYDNVSVYDNINALANVVLEKGEIFDSKYNLFSVSYSQSNPKVTSIIDYVRYLFPKYRERQKEQILRIRHFDSLMASQRNALIRQEQAEKALIELEKSNNLINELNNNLKEKVEERTKELELANEQRLNTFINLAHETKTPLTLINNYLVEYIKKYGETEEITVIRNSTEKLTKDIVNFFDLEKIKRGIDVYNHKQICDFSKILKDNIDLYIKYGASKDVEVVQSISDKIYVQADPVGIDRIVNNLIENAIRFTNSKGKVEIGLREDSNRIIFSVKDNGIGISRDLHAKIFEPYFQAKSVKSNLQGIGLGLSIVKKVIDSLNGEIAVISNPSENPGTEFLVSLTKSEQPSSENLSVSDIERKVYFNVDTLKFKEEPFDSRKQTLLIVEDNLALLNYMASKLIERYNVYIAGSGQEALIRLKSINVPDLIISDVMMDKGNGLDLYDGILAQKNLTHIPFIFLTAKNSTKDRLEGLAMGAVAYIHKPFLMEELITKINSILLNLEKQRFAIVNRAYKSIVQENELRQKETVPQNRFEENCSNYNLTQREIEIVTYIAKGVTYKAIGELLNISDKTVAKHVRNIFDKVAVNKQVELLSKLEISNIDLI